MLSEAVDWGTKWVLHAQNYHLRDNIRDPTPKDIQAHERKGAAFWCSAALYCPGPGFGVRVRLRRRGHQLKGAKDFFLKATYIWKIATKSGTMVFFFYF
jgi:hypothetical protein